MIDTPEGKPDTGAELVKLIEDLYKLGVHVGMEKSELGSLVLNMKLSLYISHHSAPGLTHDEDCRITKEMALKALPPLVENLKVMGNKIHNLLHDWSKKCK